LLIQRSLIIPMDRMRLLPSPAATLDLDVLRSVVAIADSGSIKLAAPRLGRTPAAVSMQVAKLERTLGHALFQRVHAGMRLTPAGERLVPQARRMIEIERAVLDQFRAPELSGDLFVGLVEDVAGVRLAHVLASFARSHPCVTVNVAMGPSAELAAKLAGGELDIAVFSPGGAVDRQDGDRLVFEDPLVWVGCEGGSAWRQRPMPLAVASPGCAWRRQALAALDRAGIEWWIAYASEHYAAQRSAVSADLAVAPLPRSLLAPGLIRIGASEGLPDHPGVARIAIRLAPRPEVSEPALVLAEHVARSFGNPGVAAG
jgi:DNA-binding transcriptional LysR family regulator